ncbi:MAG: sigma-54 dependent transcriptional regulator [Myxococcales bacterium]
MRDQETGEAALTMASKWNPDLVLLDVQMPGIDGFEVLRRLLARRPGLSVVMMTGFGDVPSAVKAMKLGARDFVSKPFHNEALLDTVENLFHMGRHAAGNVKAIGESAVFRKAVDFALKFALPDINVLLLGETGTGKELFARMIHEASKRSKGPFVPIDCGTLPANLAESELFGHERGSFTGAFSSAIGRLEMAQGGTLFLDEIGNLSLPFQAKLLRVLQNRSIERVGGREPIQLDIRVLSATNVNLKEAVQAGTFRQDLYYRLNEITLNLPPLRERKEDIRGLAAYFTERYATAFKKPVSGLSPETLVMLEHCPWPGNIRELENAIKGAVVLADDMVTPDCFSEELRESVSASDTMKVAQGSDERLKMEIELDCQLDRQIDLKAFGLQAASQAERFLLETMVHRRRISSAQMAKLLGVDPKTLRSKLRRYGLESGR